MKVIKLTESDIKRMVKRVLKETHGITDMQNREMGAKLAKEKERLDAEKKTMTLTLMKKIDMLLKNSVEGNLETIMNNESVKFGFTSSNEFVMVSDTANMFSGIKFSNDGWGGNFELRKPMMFTLIDSKDYVDVVETQLNDEEKSLFGEVGIVGEVKDKSIKEMIINGKIAIVLDRGNNPSMMSWKRLNITGPTSVGEKTACRGLKSFDDLGEPIPITDILNKGKKICNGGTLISNSGVTLKVFKSPMNDIIKHNA